MLQQAQTPLDRWQAIQILRSGFFDAGLGDEYALPTATNLECRAPLVSTAHRARLPI